MKKLYVALLLLLAIPVANAQLLGPVPYKNSALNTTPSTIKAGPGVLQWLQCYNPSGTLAYAQLYDNSGTVLPGTTVSTMTVPIPSGNTVIPTPTNFFNAIKISATLNAVGTGSPASSLLCNAGFN